MLGLGGGVAAHRDIGVAAAGVVGLQEGAVHKAFGDYGEENRHEKLLAGGGGRRDGGVISREETMVHKFP